MVNRSQETVFVQTSEDEGLMPINILLIIMFLGPRIIPIHQETLQNEYNV